MLKNISKSVIEQKKIKDNYGEEMLHFCKEKFRTILARSPGELYKIISSNFDKSKALYFDIKKANAEKKFISYISTFYDFGMEKLPEVTKSAKELMKDAGYELYECKTNEQIQGFRIYYSTMGREYTGWVTPDIPDWIGEELCTFGDLHKIDKYYIFFAVRDDTYKLKRDDFKNPDRDDAYSTSVLCIQFSKGDTQSVSIKSRYNHHVYHPDAVYDNDLERIAKGLTKAFERDYNFKINCYDDKDFSLDEYVKVDDGKFYKYNYRIFNKYFCLNNIIIDDGKVIEDYKDSNNYVFMDYFILDKSNKKIISYAYSRDGFIDANKNIKKTDIRNMSTYKEITITFENGTKAIIKLDERGRIIGYINEEINVIGDNFLYFNTELSELVTPKLVKCGNGMLYCNEKLKRLDLYNLEECGDYFLNFNECLEELNVPHLKKCGEKFLDNNKKIKRELLREDFGDCSLSYLEKLNNTLNLKKIK